MTTRTAKGNSSESPPEYTDRPIPSGHSTLGSHVVSRVPVRLGYRSGTVTAERIGPRAVSRLVQARANDAGFDGIAVTSHPPRAGHATTAAVNGAPIDRIAAQTRHRDLGTLVNRYIRPERSPPPPPAAILGSDRLAGCQSLVSPTILFLAMRNEPIQETAMVGGALRSIAALLPAAWIVDERAGIQLDGRQVDAVVDLVAPNGDRISFAVEAKRSGSLPITSLLSVLRELDRENSRPLLFVSDYLGPSLRAALEDEGISYADATGWVRLISEAPLVLLTGQGAAKSQRRGRKSAVLRLNGVAASRTIRALAAADLPIGVRDLAELADVSPGSVSKLLVTLAAEGIVDRDERGGVTVVRRRALIQRWIRDYTFPKANKSVSYYIAPRGLERTLARLGDSETPVALTGSAAARRLLPDGTTSVVPLRLLALYVAAPDALARDLGLIYAEPTDANVVLAAPQDQQILAPPDGEPSIVPVSLVLADLLTLPNRSDAEAEQLMDTLALGDDAWKE